MDDAHPLTIGVAGLLHGQSPRTHARLAVSEADVVVPSEAKPTTNTRFLAVAAPTTTLVQSTSIPRKSAATTRPCALSVMPARRSLPSHVTCSPAISPGGPAADQLSKP